jgi:hypothetical protein
MRAGMGALEGKPPAQDRGDPRAGDPGIPTLLFTIHSSHSTWNDGFFHFFFSIFKIPWCCGWNPGPCIY